MNSRKLDKVKLTFLYLLIVAAAGSYLRFMFIYDPEFFDFQFLLHSHSHTAILGGVYNALFIALVSTYLPGKLNSKKYNNIFWLTQVAVIGMMISFTIQGYAAMSISFSTLHILMSYVFVYYFVKDCKSVNIAGNLISLKFIYGGLFFLFLSLFGPWGLAVLAAKGLAETDLYKQAIYFYLHFQYNGWFIFSLIGLWISGIEKSLFAVSKRNLNNAFYILFFSTLPAYFLSLLGFKVGFVIWLTAILSAAVQLIGFRFLFNTLNSSQYNVSSMNNIWVYRLYRFSIYCVLLKFVLQLVSALPGAGEAAFVSREITIGYIHLVMLGAVTPGLIGWFGCKQLIGFNSRLILLGLKVYLVGFIFSEVLLFYPAMIIWFQATAIPYFTYLLFVTTLVMTAAVIMIYIRVVKSQSKVNNVNP